MPVDRRVRMSLIEFADQLCLDPTRVISVEIDRRSSTVVIVQEPTDETAPSPDATGHP